MICDFNCEECPYSDCFNNSRPTKKELERLESVGMDVLTPRQIQQKEYRERPENRERMRTYLKEYREKNKARLKAYRSAYYYEHREYELARQAEYDRKKRAEKNGSV